MWTKLYFILRKFPLHIESWRQTEWRLFETVEKWTTFPIYRKVNKCYKGGSSPIVVHCSDGVDRTGAYCLIDLVLNRMAKGVKEIDIAATLEHLRDQRADVVRTKEQFEFVLTAVAQEIQAILKSMPQK